MHTGTVNALPTLASSDSPGELHTVTLTGQRHEKSECFVFIGAGSVGSAVRRDFLINLDARQDSLYSGMLVWVLDRIGSAYALELT